MIRTNSICQKARGTRGQGRERDGNGTGTGRERDGNGTGTGTGNRVYSFPDRDFPTVSVLGFCPHRLPSRPTTTCLIPVTSVYHPAACSLPDYVPSPCLASCPIPTFAHCRFSHPVSRISVLGQLFPVHLLPDFSSSHYMAIMGMQLSDGLILDATTERLLDCWALLLFV